MKLAAKRHHDQRHIAHVVGFLIVFIHKSKLLPMLKIKIISGYLYNTIPCTSSYTEVLGG